MDGSACTLAFVLAVFALVTARAHISSHDNILRIQLWDAEGLSKDPITTLAPTTTSPPRTTRRHKLKVNLDSLYDAMLEEGRVGGFSRFTRHKMRHKRRRPRQSGTDLPWRFHSGNEKVNVAVYNDDVPWDVIEADNGGPSVTNSAVSESASSPVNEQRDVGLPLPQRQLENEDEEEKKLPVVPKCCPVGQNLTVIIEDGISKTICAQSILTFLPIFFDANETHIYDYDSNVYETIVGCPCRYDKYKLEPHINSRDEFNLLINGSLFMPYGTPYLLNTKDYCMETFWNESVPAGLTLPVVCFQSPIDETKMSSTLIVYGTGLLISVPFLLATASVYLFIIELRDTHGKALACHTICLALAFTCLAATQLAGHAFHKVACNIMAYLIQFSFISCFFWLNVMCFDTFLNVRRYINSSVTRRSMRRRFAWYTVYAVLLPLLLLVITITMDLSPAVPSSYVKPNFSVTGCWFKTDQAALPYFYGPVALILLSNFVLFILTSRAFIVHYDKLKDMTPLELTHSDFSTSDDWVRLSSVLGQPIPAHDPASSPHREAPVNFKQRLKKYKKIFRMCCMLSFIMGLSWVLEVVSWAAGAGDSAVSVWSAFDLINALQGVFIFAIFVLQQPVRSIVLTSHLFNTCKRKTNGSEVSVVSEKNVVIRAGKRDYV